MGDSPKIAQVTLEVNSFTKIFDYGGQNSSSVITPYRGVRGVGG